MDCGKSFWSEYKRRGGSVSLTQYIGTNMLIDQVCQQKHLITFASTQSQKPARAEEFNNCCK